MVHDGTLYLFSSHDEDVGKVGNFNLKNWALVASHLFLRIRVGYSGKTSLRCLDPVPIASTTTQVTNDGVLNQEFLLSDNDVVLVTLKPNLRSPAWGRRLRGECSGSPR